MKRDLRFALRLFARSPGWTIIAIVSLALGIGANTAVFSLIEAVLLKPFPYRDAERLVLIWGSRSETTTRGISGPDLKDWREQNHTFESIDSFLGNGKFSLGSDPADTVPSACIGAGVLPMLGVQPALGRNFTIEDEKPGAASVVILSAALWRSRFASDPAIIGRTVRLNDRPYEVIGVTPSGFFFPDTEARLWEASPCGLTGFDQRGWPLLHAIGRLRPGTSLPEAQADLDRINAGLAQAFPDTNRGTTAGLFALRHVVIGKFEQALWILLVALFVLLLIACANLIHLQLARAIQRETELAVRAAIGASRTRLVRQLLTETLTLTAVAALLGVFIGWVAIRAVHGLELSDIPRMDRAALDGRVLAFTAAISSVAGVLSAVWPAWRISSVRLADRLNSSGTSTTPARGRQWRGLLAINEIAAAITLLVAAGLLVRSFVYLSHASWGFNPDRLLLVDVKVPQEFRQDRNGAGEWAKSVLANLRAIEGVQRVSRSDSAPIRWGAWKPTRLAVNGSLMKGLSAGAWVVGDGYFATAGIPVVEGREFDTSDTAPSAPRVVVSRTLAERLWPNERAVGKRLQILVMKSGASGNPPPEILGRLKKHDLTLENDPTVFEPVEGKSWDVIGVVQDVRMFSLDVVGDPALYLNHEQNPTRMWGMDLSRFSVKFLIRTSDDPAAITARATSAVVSVNSHATVTDIARMQDIVSAKVGGRGTSKLMVVVSTVFGSLALTFAVIGIYGVVSHTVSQRMREVGIRVALGAERRDIARLVIGYSVRLLFSGLALGLTAAWATTRALESQLAGVKVTDSVTYTCAIALLSAAVIVASVVPLRRALRINPIALLRTT